MLIVKRHGGSVLKSLWLISSILSDLVIDLRFVCIDLSRESAPGAIILLKFHRLLEEYKLTERIFAAINTLLDVKELMIREGIVVDATIIGTPSSTKNQSGNAIWRCTRQGRAISGILA